jgi:hypothetical protein
MSEQNQSPPEDSTSQVDPIEIGSQVAADPPIGPSVQDDAQVSTSAHEKAAIPEPAPAVSSPPSTSRLVEKPDVPESATELSTSTDPAGATRPRVVAIGDADELRPSEIVVEGSSEPDSESESKARLDAGDAAVLAASRKHTRRSFVAAAAGAAAGYGFYRWIDQSPGDEMQPEPFRRTFQANATIARDVFRDHALTPTYPLKDARDLRVNGVYGLKSVLMEESWRLQLVGSRHDAAHLRFTNDVTAWEYKYIDADSHEDQGHDTKVDPNMKSAEKMAPEPMLNQAKAQEDHTGRMPRGKEEAGESRSTLKPRTPGLLLTMEDILELPRHELVTQFKCIEGWSQIVHWAGVRMADFVEAYPPEAVDGREPKYVYMETPDGDYYTGYDLDVCRHPQTLLVTEMMGAPLTQFHGAPLRLHMPTKYGYKQIKRIGLISYTNQRPDDYWTKLGYDWYAGL